MCTLFDYLYHYFLFPFKPVHGPYAIFSSPGLQRRTVWGSYNRFYRPCAFCCPKVTVYKAVCISTLLFGSEAWALYRSLFTCTQAWSVSHPESSAYSRVDMGWSHSTRRDPPSHRLLQHRGPHHTEATTLDRACNPHASEPFAKKAFLWRADLRLSLMWRAKKEV